MNSFSSYDAMIALYEKIRDRIKDRPDVTQALLAKEVGVTREHLNRMLSNKYPMKVETLIHLMILLDMNRLL
ncbi:MAG: helix-turn-helix domain-containing protein [Bacilli bacterium]|nr:helix-turn-helix domain-containing protein [Bacilli bacterium]